MGGGLPVGVFGGKRQFMDLLAPLGPVYQAGTLSGNPLAMAAGLATIGYLQEHAAEVYAQLEAKSRAVAEGVAQEAARCPDSPHHQPRRRHVDLVLHGWTRHELRSRPRNPTRPRSAASTATMLEQGIWLPPSQFEAAFLSTAHSDADIAATIAAARAAFAS